MVLIKQKYWIMLSELTWIKSKQVNRTKKYRLIIDINKTKLKKKMLLKDWTKVYLTDQLKQKQSTAFQNKMIHVVYQIFNSFGFNKEFAPLLSKKESEKTEEKMQIPLFSKKESEQTEDEIQIPLWFKINKPELDELTNNIYDNQNNKEFKITINKKLMI